MPTGCEIYLSANSWLGLSGKTRVELFIHFERHAFGYFFFHSVVWSKSTSNRAAALPLSKLSTTPTLSFSADCLAKSSLAKLMLVPAVSRYRWDGDVLRRRCHAEPRGRARRRQLVRRLTTVQRVLLLLCIQCAPSTLDQLRRSCLQKTRRLYSIESFGFKFASPWRGEDRISSSLGDM